ncbi:ATP-binding cassette domain-containing protein [Paenibacillus thiaminolyticus]|uniref:ribosomal protection-like ABC-F family protein n=1 Tax=Paenibacillus thiaminolyticus TaxID=49283 RepID=UPI0023503027|nr:ABC-F family ATP-binding cassette domain-containing protein [Paenibacillus thiaminolyticus]WCR29847.1 ATP-binding cassette domain-containing protein [Paenibacillus thiaminolyticus]
MNSNRYSEGRQLPPAGKLVLEASGLAAEAGDRRLFSIPETLRVYSGERIGLIGANGAGKTTLIRILAGLLEPAQGSVRRIASCAFVPQLDDIRDEASAEATLSGGERTKRRLEQALQGGAELLLLDEPTSHLDMEQMKRMEERLLDFSRTGTLLLISHDRTLLNRVCTKIWEMENGTLHIYAGGYDDYRVEKERLRTEREREYGQYIAERDRLQEMIVQTRVMAQGVGTPRPRKGLTSKEIRSARPHFNRKQGKMDKRVKAMETRLEKLPQVERPFELPSVAFDAECHRPLRSKSALEVKELRLCAGERELVRDGSFRIRPQMKVALLGPNGSGKTTLLRLLKQRSETPDNTPDCGPEASASSAMIRFAPNARVAYFDQKLYSLDLQESALENVQKSSAYDQTAIRTALARLRLRRDEALKPVWQLSGGEKVKTQLVKLFLSEANVLLLDEPTNYLDIEAREELERVLAAYPGTLLFATHDRMLLERTATHVLRISGQSLELLPIEALHADRESPPPQDSQAEGTALQQAAWTEEQRMKVELEWSELLSRLSQPVRHCEAEKERLERRYAELLELRRAMR